MHDEHRYTPDEMFDQYFEFLKDETVQRKLTQRGIRTWEHEELLFRFLAYVKNVEFIIVKRESELRKMQEWGEQQQRELEEKKKGSPGIPVITGQNSLSRHAKPLEILC